MALSRNLGTLTSWNSLCTSGPVIGLIYLYIPETNHVSRVKSEVFCGYNMRYMHCYFLYKLSVLLHQYFTQNVRSPQRPEWLPSVVP